MSSTAASAIDQSGLVRWAPFGVPVVPEVRITKRGLVGRRLVVGVVAVGHRLLQRRLAERAGRRRARRRSARTPGSTPDSRVLELFVVDQRLRPLALHHVDQLRAGEHRVQVERRGAELGRRPGVASRKPRWLRAMIPTPSPGPIPIAANSWPSALERLCRRSQVSEPRSSRIAISCGCSIAAVATPVAGQTPQRRKVRAHAQGLVRAHRRDHARLAHNPSPRREDLRQPPGRPCHPYLPSNRKDYWPGSQEAISVPYRSGFSRPRPRRRRYRRCPRRGRSNPCPRWWSP